MSMVMTSAMVTTSMAMLILGMAVDIHPVSSGFQPLL